MQSQPSQTKVAPVPARAPAAQGGVLQRKCACGQHTIAGGECETCGKERLQRSAATGRAEQSRVPPVLEEAVAHSPGQALDVEARVFMESRFGHDFSRVAVSPQSKDTVSEPGDRFEQEADRLAEQVMRAPGSQPGRKAKSSLSQAGNLPLQNSEASIDDELPEPQQHFSSRGRNESGASNSEDSQAADFSQVRVHTDARAAEAARAINARAFTLGRDIFFSDGEYAPHESEGKRLLAHELSHVAQQQRSARENPGPVVQRKRERTPFFSGVYDFFSNIVQAISSGFSDETLQEYVETIIETGVIEDSFDSDNKAMEVYKAWKAGADKSKIKIGQKSYQLTDKLKSLLAQELRAGSADKEEKQAAQELQTFSPKAAPTAAAAPEAAPQAETPQPEAKPPLTEAEMGAARIRESLKGQVEVKDFKGKKYQVGGIEANAEAQADIKTGNLLTNKEDTAHIEFFGKKLGIDMAYDTPRDAFRWNILKEVIATGKVDFIATSAGANFDVREAFKGQVGPKVQRTLQLIQAKGAAIMREELFRLIAASQNPRAVSFVSATDRDQVVYIRGGASLPHEFFGHVWLAMHGVLSGHGESLKGTQTVTDPFGEAYTGSVNDFISAYVQPASEEKSRSPRSSSLEVTDQTFEDALNAFVRAASAKDAFTVSAGRAPSSREFQDRWRDLRRFYLLLLINYANEGKRLARITTELKKVYAAYTEDFQEAFDIFFFYQASSLGAITPETHVVRQLDIKDPRQRPQKKGKVQRSATGPAPNESVPAIVKGAMRSRGQPLDQTTRALMESRFNQDFSRVRVHTDAIAADAATALRAKAYTHERDIYFASGKYQPQTTDGRRLLAHELTHTIQQQSAAAGVAASSQASVSREDDPLEREAESVAERVSSGAEVSERAVSEAVNNHLILRDPLPEGEILPEPIDVNWGGDPFHISFEHAAGATNQFVFVVKYTGPHPVDGPFIKDRTVRVGVGIGSAKPQARIRAQDDSSVTVYVYGDNTQIARLVEDVRVETLGVKRRAHSFSAKLNGMSYQTASLNVLDPKAKVEKKPEPLTTLGDVPGERPTSRLVLRPETDAETRIDGDGDQSKELLVQFKAKTFWQGVASSSSGVQQSDAVKTLNVRVTQISSKAMQQFDVDVPQPTIQGSLFPVVEEVTDGKGPTKISLITPVDTQWLEIFPPEQTAGLVKYGVKAPGLLTSVQFPAEVGAQRKIATADAPKIIGNFVSDTPIISTLISWDVTFGAYDDRFRITVRSLSRESAILGISPLYRGEPVGGAGAELKLKGPVRFGVINSSNVALDIDLDGDGNPNLSIYDRLTTPQEVDGGGPPEKNRNHRLRVTGDITGGESFFDFQVRYGSPIAGADPNTATAKAAVSSSMAVSGLTAQEKGGTFSQQLDAAESVLMAARKRAFDQGVIRKATFDAWSALSSAMIRLRPQIGQAVDGALQAEAARQAAALNDALRQETKHKETSGASTEASSSYSNPYTGRTVVISPGNADTSGAGPELAGNIKAGQWSEAFSNYQKLVSGLDRWIVDNSREKKVGRPEEINQVEQVLGARQELNAIEKYNPTRVLAVFHPDEKFKTEQGYVAQIPLALYYWREGDTYYLKNLTNPSKAYHYTVAAPTTAGGVEPPTSLLNKLNDPDHFPVGTIHFNIPGHYGGVVQTTDYLTWKKFFTYLGLGLAVVGASLATFGAGTYVAVAGAWALGASALAGATAAGIDLAEHIQQGNLDATTAVLDIAQIVAGLAGASAVASGTIIRSAANAPAASRWAGAWAKTAMLADRVYIPATVTAAGADIISFVTLTKATATQLDDIQKGPGSQPDKDRAKGLLFSQLVLAGGLTVLSIKGTAAEFVGRPTLILHPGPDGVPVVSTALSRKSVVIDTQTASALAKKAQGGQLQEGEKAMVKRIEALGDVDLRVADPTIAERAAKGAIDPHKGIGVMVDRNSKEYQDLLAVLVDKKVGGTKANSARDRAIVADTFFAGTEPGVTPTFATHDAGIYNNLARIYGYEPARNLSVPEKFPTGFDVTINNKTIHVLPLK